MMKIEFITNDSLSMELYKPEPVKKHFPEWFKETPHATFDPLDAPSYGGAGSVSPYTITSCVPVKDYMTSGYIIRNTYDVVITPLIDRDPVDFCDYTLGERFEFHRHGQCPVAIKGKRRDYFKYINHWLVKTPPGYSCMFYQPEYFFESRFRLFPGIVDTDSYNMPVNFIGTILADESFLLEAGTPLMVVFPFKREEWDSDVKEALIKQDNRFIAKLSKVYRTLCHTKKVYR